MSNEIAVGAALDISMPRLSGIEAARRLCDLESGTAVVYSMTVFGALIFGSGLKIVSA